MLFELLTGKLERATKDSAALDLFYSGTQPMLIGDRPIPIPTGVRTAFSPGHVAIIKEKSGLALKGLEIKGGVIDADYRDEWMVIARNPMWFEFHEEAYMGNLIPDTRKIELVKDWQPFTIQPGMKIAQVIFLAIPKVDVRCMIGAEVNLKDVGREGGFGSTGK